MKYIKKYEIKRYEQSIPSSMYKDGDIVFLKKNKQKEHEVDGGALRILDNLNPIQMIHIQIFKHIKYYYINVENWYQDKFYIEADAIKRLATPKEIEKYWLEKDIKKFNL